jgi:hypothetical protein
MTSIIEAAQQFYAWGANVTAIAPDSKSPMHAWKHLYSQRQEADEASKYQWHKAIGVGIVNGPGDWRTLDIDACKTTEHDQITPVSESVLLRVLHALDLPDNYRWTWRSGSGTGWEIAIRCADEIPEGSLSGKEKGVYWGDAKNPDDFDHIEVRWEKTQTIAPPSAYFKPGAPGYQWRSDAPTEAPAIVSVGHVVTAFYTIAKRKDDSQPAKLAKPAPMTTPLPRTIDEDDAKEQIRERFDLVTYAAQKFGGKEQHEGSGEVRILGQGGLLISPERQTWYNHSWTAGGDCFDLAGHHLYDDQWNRNNGAMFRAALEEAARFTGITLPQRERQQPTYTPPPIATDELQELKQLNAQQLLDRLVVLLPAFKELSDRYYQLEMQLDVVRKRNRFVAQAEGADGIKSAGMRLTLIQLRKYLDNTPPEDRLPDGWIPITLASMGIATNQNSTTVGRQLDRYKELGYIDRFTDRAKLNPVTKKMGRQAYFKALVDLDDPNAIKVDAKPRGKTGCKKCGGENLEQRTHTKCRDCGHEQYGEWEETNPTPLSPEERKQLRREILATNRLKGQQSAPLIRQRAALIKSERSYLHFAGNSFDPQPMTKTDEQLTTSTADNVYDRQSHDEQPKGEDYQQQPEAPVPQPARPRTRGYQKPIDEDPHWLAMQHAQLAAARAEGRQEIVATIERALPPP